MTTPSPYLTPGKRAWGRGDDAVPPGSWATGRASSAVAQNGSVAVQAPAAYQRPELTSMLLPLGGAAGTTFLISNLDRGHADLTIDGVRVKRENTGDFKVPMEQGGPEKLQVRAAIPGYPTIKFQGKTLYKSPRPPLMYTMAYVAMIIGATLLVASFGGVALAGAATMAAGYAGPSLMLKAKGKGIPLVVLLVVGVALAVFGVAHVVVSGMPR